MLCLHGTCASEHVLRFSLGRLVLKCQKAGVEMVFVTGPLDAEDEGLLAGEAGKVRRAMIESLRKQFPTGKLCDFVRYRVDQGTGEIETVRTYDGLEEALGWLQGALREHAPIDGVLGFSQGANMASLLAGMAAAGAGANLGFAIHLCGSRPGWHRQRPEFFCAPVPLRSLHISGLEDIDTDGQRRAQCPIAELYERPCCLSHFEGHRPIPGRSREAADETAQAILDFILGKPLLPGKHLVWPPPPPAPEAVGRLL